MYYADHAETFNLLDSIKTLSLFPSFRFYFLVFTVNLAGGNFIWNVKDDDALWKLYWHKISNKQQNETIYILRKEKKLANRQYQMDDLTFCWCASRGKLPVFSDYLVSCEYYFHAFKYPSDLFIIMIIMGNAL